MFDQYNITYLISLSILATSLLDVWILKEEVTCQSHLRVKGKTRSAATPTYKILVNHMLASGFPDSLQVPSYTPKSLVV